MNIPINKSAFKYLAVGSSAFVVDYLTLVLLYYVLNVNVNIATSAGFIAGFIVSFYFNRKWVFGAAGAARKAHRQLIEYAALVVFNYFVTLVLINLLQNHGVTPSIGKLFVMAAITTWNYYLFKRFIFK